MNNYCNCSPDDITRIMTSSNYDSSELLILLSGGTLYPTSRPLPTAIKIKEVKKKGTESDMH